jgi:hypothetical protein
MQEPTYVYVENSPAKSAYVGSFIVSVWIDTIFGFEPEVTVNEIRECFDNAWLITVNNVTHIFKAALDKYTDVRYHHSNISLYNDRMTFARDISKLGSDMCRKISPDNTGDAYRLKKGVLFVKKTFFCHQVSISYDIHYNNTDTRGVNFLIQLVLFKV